METNADDHFEEEEVKDKPSKTNVVEEVQKAIAEKGVEEVDVEEKIKEAYDFLRYNADTRRSKEYLTEEGLKIYSPKFRAILNNITDPDHKGLHLVYSQWRTLEGIGLFKMVL